MCNRLYTQQSQLNVIFSCFLNEYLSLMEGLSMYWITCVKRKKFLATLTNETLTWISILHIKEILLKKTNVSFIHFKLRSAFNKIPDFFVKAFKIFVDSWKFTMLLLYILWDDWPMFRISASKEHLQQQLEYTLLKPDCQSWWILKMQSDTLEERYAIKLF